MSENLSRFNVKNKSKITDEYVIYVENLFVSFEIQKNKRHFFKKIIPFSKPKIVNDEKDLEFEKNDNEQSENKKKISKFKKKTLVKRVLKGVTFYLKKGETLAILGANGAGKTVLVETILGLNKIDSGNIYLNLGKEDYRTNLKETGMQFQQSKFPKKEKVVKLISKYKKIYGKKVDQNQLDEMIDVFGIRDFYNNKIDSLSGGQKQRVNLLLSIMHNPKIMILDEFITGLDILSVRKIVTYVNELKVKNGASMIIISHQPDEIEELADRIIVLNNGIITLETNVKTILKNNNMASFIEDNI